MSDQTALDFDHAEAERRKTDGMAQANLAAAQDWKETWDDAIRFCARTGIPFTSDDVRSIAGPPGDHPNAAGSRFTIAAKAGLIRSIGYRKSARVTLHRHPLTLWVGA